MRRAAVAGTFYEGRKENLEEQLKKCFSGVSREEEDILGAVVPHAGYMFSGGVAAHAYANLTKTEADTNTNITFVILGPNHTGMGSPIATARDTWATPLGEVEVDETFVDALSGTIIVIDETTHIREHSIEVQLPFLQFLFHKNFKFVPICLGLSDEETAKEIGETLAKIISVSDKKVIVLASSDFTHYEPDNIAREKDKYVIEAITELNVGKFYHRIYERNVSACGVGPIASMMYAVKKLGAKRGKLVKYATSGDIIGDRSSVVGYAAIVIF
jgi:hypothetical protein